SSVPNEKDDSENRRRQHSEPGEANASKRARVRRNRSKPDQVEGEHEGNSHHVVNPFDEDRHEGSARPHTRITHRQHHRSDKLSRTSNQENRTETDRCRRKKIRQTGRNERFQQGSPAKRSKKIG